MHGRPTPTTEPTGDPQASHLDLPLTQANVLCAFVILQRVSPDMEPLM